MVFESIVSNLLNTFLGDYVENLDSSQLNIGIWGGDVVLNNLNIRPSALDNLDLPLKLKSGFLAKLTLKIPWKNLYTEPVIADIEGLYVLAVPNIGIKYDADKENKQAQDAKQGELSKIEEARKLKKKKAAEKDKPPPDDTFAEKMVAQVIKNLQVTIKDIHIRYEDQYTNRKRPFALGVTLHGLTFQTTDENWRATVIKDTVKLFHKLIDLDSMSFYWNSDAKLISDLKSNDEIRDAMKNMIATKDRRPNDFTYILAPISINAKLVLNQKPESDGTNFQTPKVLLTVGIKEIGLNIGKYQYQDILEFLEAQERLKLNAKYRKYRPELKEYKKHAKEWWHFAMTCILEEAVKRKNRNWSWEHMKEHRRLVKSYKDAWVDKATNKSPSKESLHIVEVAEKTLDVFNLNIGRQQAELEINRRGLTRVEDQQGWIGWAKSWWGGGGEGKEKKEDYATQFEKAMTADERSKLYDALDYKENQAPTMYPKEFVENKILFSLDNLAIVVHDDIAKGKRLEVVTVSLQSVAADIEQRPAAQAIRIKATMRTFMVEGIRDEGRPPPVIASSAVKSTDDGQAQLTAFIETNPLDDSCDQLVKLRVLPQNVVYHAPSVNKLAVVFRPPESVRLTQLTAAAFAKYEDIKVRSATGLAYAMENRSRLKLDMEIQPCCIQIPESGIMEKNSSVLVVDLGTLKISTVDCGDVHLNEQFYAKSEEEKLKELMAKAYDKFRIDLKSLQILFASPRDNWQSARKEGKSNLHVLQPTGFEIVVEKASIVDLRIPQLRVVGNLPDLFVNLSDLRLLMLLKLLLSIPTPPPPPPGEVSTIEDIIIPEPDIKTKAKMHAIMEVNEAELNEEDEEKNQESNTKVEKVDEKQKEQQVAVELTMVLNYVQINVSKVIGEEEQPYISFGMHAIGIDFKMRSLDMTAIVFLGGIELEHKQFRAFNGNGPLYILESASKMTPDKRLLKLEYVQADKKSPFFASDYGMVEQMIRITSEPLILGVHQEALMDIQIFLQNLQTEMAKIKPPAPPPPPPPVPLSKSGSGLQRMISHVSSSNLSLKSMTLAEQRKRRLREQTTHLDDKLINMKLEASLNGVDIVLGTSKGLITVVTTKGMDATVTMRPKSLQAIVAMRTIGITYPNDQVKHHKILSVAGKEVFRLDFMQFNRTDEEKKLMQVNDVDMAVKLQVAEMRFVFLNLWLNNLLAFAEPFQKAAAEAAAAGGAALSQGAKDAVEIFKEQQISKMKLDVDINAPIVIMPQNSRSDEAILVHFGKLSVYNKFDTLRTSLSNDLVVLDEMAVKLTDMRLARVILGKDGWTAVAECRLLEPVTFMLSVSRNLSFTWFKEKPEIAIYAKLPHLKVTASQEDYSILMKILSENLAEGATPTKPPSPKAVIIEPVQETTDQPKTTGESQLSKQEVRVETHGPPEPARTSAAKMQFAFQLEEISAFLYTGSSNLLEGVAVRDRKKAFAGIQIVDISVKGVMRDDTSMDADVVLHTLIMDDLREGQIGITRLMDKKGDSAQSINVLDVAYRKKTNGDQNADIIMRPFFFCVCPEFLGALMSFFTAPAGTPVDEAGRTPVSSNKAAETKKQIKKPESPAADQAPAGIMKVKIVVEDPEIILVEDASKPETSLAVVLQFKCDFTMTQSADQTALKGGITDLEIFSSYYALSLRDKNKKHVLNPCEIILTGKMSNDNGHRIDIEFTDVIMRISPSIIRLFSAVGAGMSVPQEESIREKKAKTIARKHVWEPKAVKDCNFWYLQEVLPAEEATETIDFGEELPPDEPIEQELLVKMETFVFMLEADAGAGTIPMILLKSSLKNVNIQNWSSELEVDGDLTLEMAYFNENFNVWEHLIEPLEVKNGYRPWEISLHVKTQNEYEMTDDDQVLPPPKMEIALVSTDIMNITVTKTCLDLMTKLGDAFNKAAKNIPPSKSMAIELNNPYTISNEAGLDVEIMPTDSLELPPAKFGKILPYSEYVPLVNKVIEQSFLTVTREEISNEWKLDVRLSDLNTIRTVDVSRAEKRIFGLPKTTHPGDQWQLLVDVSSHYGKKLITLRSILRVKNHLPIPVEVYYQNDTNLESCGVIDVDGEINLPLQSVYTPTGDLFFRPVDDQYDVSKPAVNWRSFNSEQTTTQILQCSPTASDAKAVFYIQVWAELESAFFENTNKKNLTTQSYTVHLRPPVTFYNVLPYPIQILAPKCPQFSTLQSGESTSLYSVCPGQSLIEIKVMASVEWMCRVRIEENSEELTAHTFTSKRSDNSTSVMDLGIRTTAHQGSRDMSLYCPFWMVNKTGLKLAYKDEALKIAKTGSSKTKKSQSCPCISGAASSKRLSEGSVDLPTEHPADYAEPVMFTFNGKNFFDKKKACLKVADSEWSEKFPVDTVGSAGRISCKTNGGRDLEVSLTIQLSNSGLTKICTFTPFYMIDNRCASDVEVQETAADAKWTLIPTAKCVPYWPVTSGKAMQMSIRYAGTTEESLAFPFFESFEAFVPIQNEYVGVDVCSHITEGSVVVEIDDYKDGMAPALIINATDSHSVMYTQDEINDWKTLAPSTCILFKWERLTGKRSLLWSCGEKKNVKDGLFKDGTGDFSVDKHTEGKAFWVSFLDGRQRVLLFTEDLAVATMAQAYEAERIDSQITLSLQGIGLSLVNNIKNAEIAYIGISSSGIIWEFKKKRFKAMSLKECRELELAFAKYGNEKATGKKMKSRLNVDKLDVDFEQMIQYTSKSDKDHRQIRRSFQAGLWVRFKLSTHQQQLHIKLNHFQVDNQLPACVFPIVFAPVPPPKSVAAESIPKSFAEVSFVARKAEHSTVPQIKYFKVLVQEMAVQADQGFINAIIAFFGGEQKVSLYTTELYRKDKEITQQDLAAYASVTSSTEQKAFYDELHFSPIKVHLSFSLGGASTDVDAGGSKKSLQIHSEFLNLLLKSVGVTLTDVQDIVFKLAYFERNAVFLNQPQLISEVTNHYAMQAVKQLYVLVLGLDIIGNPFGLIRDLGTGVETLFYEPFQGAIQGPEEFAEGLALGVKSLFGHAVGGAAGAVSRITGTLGKGLAALTMDDEYQKKRQEMMNRRPANVREGFMQGGKGLVMGVYDGVTGVFLKPMEGAKQEGALGFAKGVGKGLVGLVTRPTSGLVDFASSSLDSVRKVTDVNLEVKKMRPPRYIHPDKIVRPFSLMEAEGNQMLHSIDKGKFTPTDHFIAYAPLTKDKAFYVILTDQRIMLVSKSDVFGGMEVDWSYTWTELNGPPILVEKGLQVKLKEPKKKVLGVFGKSSGGKLIHFPDDQIAKWIAEKCQTAYRTESGSV